MCTFACKKHGQNGCWFVCPHIVKRLEDNLSISSIHRIGDHFVELINHCIHLCDDCFVDHDIIESELAFTEYWNSQYDRFDIEPACGACLYTATREAFPPLPPDLSGTKWYYYADKMLQKWQYIDG